MNKIASLNKKYFLFPFIFLLYLLAIFDLNLPLFKSASIVLVALLSILFLKSLKTILNQRYFYQLVCFLYFFCIFVLFRSINTNLDYALIYSKVILFVIISFCVTLLIIEKYSINYFLAIFFSVLTLQSLSPWLFINFEFYRDVVSSLQFFDPVRNFETRGIMAIRKSFISGGGGYFGMAVGLGLALIMATWFFIQERVNKYFFVVFFILLSIAAILAGRTAIMFVLVSLIVLFFHARTSSKIFLVITFAMVFIFFLLAIEWLFEVRDDYKVLAWAMEPVFNFFSYQTFESESAEVLGTMFFVPEARTFLIGDGFYYTETGSYYGGTDVGYLRQILFGGISVVLFSIFYLFYALSNGNRWIMVSIAIPLMIAHLKGGVLLATPVSMALLSSFSAYLYYKKKNRI